MQPAAGDRLAKKSAILGETAASSSPCQISVGTWISSPEPTARRRGGRGRARTRPGLARRSRASRPRTLSRISGSARISWSAAGPLLRAVARVDGHPLELGTAVVDQLAGNEARVTLGELDHRLAVGGAEKRSPGRSQTGAGELTSPAAETRSGCGVGTGRRVRGPRRTSRRRRSGRCRGRPRALRCRTASRAASVRGGGRRAVAGAVDEDQAGRRPRARRIADMCEPGEARPVEPEHWVRRRASPTRRSRAIVRPRAEGAVHGRRTLASAEADRREVEPVDRMVVVTARAGGDVVPVVGHAVDGDRRGVAHEVVIERGEGPVPRWSRDRPPARPCGCTRAS